jgi:hypothetical protein
MAVRRTRAVAGQIGPVQCPRDDPWRSPRPAEVSPGLSAPQTPSPWRNPSPELPDPPGVLF